MIGLDRKETVTVDLPHTGPVEIRHKWDGCWEIYQQDPGLDSEDVIHIESEDVKAFLSALVKATTGWT